MPVPRYRCFLNVTGLDPARGSPQGCLPRCTSESGLRKNVQRGNRTGARASNSFAQTRRRSRIAYVARVESNMAKPILLCVDDDADVLRAIERDFHDRTTAPSFV